MFYSIRLLVPKGNDTAADYEGDYDHNEVYELDLSGWDVSKVKSFHHMFAHSANILLKGVENWQIGAKVEPVEGDNESYITMNCFLHCTVNEYYDLSSWDVSKVKDFRGMFRQCKKLVKVDGLDKWDTSNGECFAVMFTHCVSMTSLDVSGFDTRKAHNYNDPYRADDYETYTGNSMFGFFGHDSEEEGVNMKNLRKIKVGENFSFNGDGTSIDVATLPTIDTTIFTESDNNWYRWNGKDLVAHSPSQPANLTAATYYVTKELALENDKNLALINNGTLIKTANSLRKIGLSGKFLPSAFPELILGLSVGDYDSGIEDGKQAEYDRFWDVFQDNGNRRNYWGGFAGWKDAIFKPKYPIIASTCNSMFYRAAIPNLPIIDLSQASSIANTFDYTSGLTSIEKIILKSNGSQTFTQGFAGCSVLAEVRFEGIIGNNLTMKDCKKLSAASIENIINALSTTASGKNITFSTAAINTAFETSEGAANGSTSTEWAALIATRSNWTVNLA